MEMDLTNSNTEFNKKLYVIEGKTTKNQEIIESKQPREQGDTGRNHKEIKQSFIHYLGVII
jgi:hypothetical protein